METCKGRDAKSVPPKKEGAIRKILSKMSKELLAQISTRSFPNSPPSTDIGDLADRAGDERDQELSLPLTGRQKEKLPAVEEALEKLHQGTYGICEECGNLIKPGRLRAIPLGKLCVACQAKLEKEMSLQKEEEQEPESPDPDLVREV